VFEQLASEMEKLTQIFDRIVEEKATCLQKFEQIKSSIDQLIKRYDEEEKQRSIMEM
jgi:tRNA(Ser,Leu) C12 N-acetylase TAN1